MLIICEHLQAVVLVNIRLKKKKSSLNFEIKNKALTSIIIKNFENGPQFKPCSPLVFTDWHKGSNQYHKWENHQFCKENIWQDCAVHIQAVMTLNRILHYPSCRLQKLVLPAETYWYPHTLFLSENICSQTNQARCSACNETTTTWGWTYGISILTSQQKFTLLPSFQYAHFIKPDSL